MDYKNTLNLPQTDFPMKANLPQREPEFLSFWESQKIYDQLREQNKNKPAFILHDGPPYANGHIHFGHILNKILKDIIVKYKSMAGFNSPYIPGWDCHGLPIELGAVKELGEREKDPQKFYDPLIRREACRTYAKRFIQDQRDQFKRLGIFGDWEHPYLTLDHQYEADIAREFLNLYLKGYVYRGKKPVYWCLSCKTALAEAEVEYEDQTSSSILVPFKLIQPEKLGLVTAPVFFVIWTTTPWTLPANLALAVGKDFTYVALSVDNRVYIVAQNLKEAFLSQLAVPPASVNEIKTFLGQELIEAQLETEHPFLARRSPVFEGPHVTLEAGTGVVHIAPGHGQEDYHIGLTHKLEILCPVDGAGRLMAGSMALACDESIKSWEGMNVKELNPLIVTYLHNQGLLLNAVGSQLRHSYPHCWRCKKPVIFRATEQWFCSLEHGDLRKRSLKAINSEVRWVPSWGRDRIYGMIEARPDWCLSRQRIWGVPIIVHYCTQCQKPHLTKASGEFIIKAFEEQGADAWWKDDKPLLPEDTTCDCGGTTFVKDGSILDVWFDSGVSHAAVLERRAELKSPADLYLEGSDQHRGWFHSSLLTSMATRERPPYKTVLTHGFVVDGQGRKYSKSAKNYVPPEKILGELGAELLRLWVAAEDYRNDIRVSDEIIKVLAEIYRKIRNTCRFMLGNLYDFDPILDYVPTKERTELDRFALHMLHQVAAKVKKAYDDYEFHAVHHTLNKFFTVDLSATYLDILKDRLYCDVKKGPKRRSAQSTLYDILMTLTPLMSPILSFTSEEIWRFLPAVSQKPVSVFLAGFRSVPEEWRDGELEARFARIATIRDEVLKVLEVARQKKEIAHSLDANVTLAATGEALSFLKRYELDWAQILIVSQVQVVEDLPHFQAESRVVASLKIAVKKSECAKCERCWNYAPDVGQEAQWNTLCGRCASVVKNSNPKAHD